MSSLLKPMFDWARFSGFPIYASGWLREGVVITNRRVKDLDEDGSRLLQETFMIGEGECLKRVPQLVTDLLKPVGMDLSPSGSHTLVLRNGKDDQPIVELNSAEGASRRIDASSLHGKNLGDGWFSSISWSDDEQFAAYTSCSKRKGGKPASLLDTEGPQELRGSKFEFKDDWGEKYVGVSSTTISVINVKTGKIVNFGEFIDGGGELSVGQPVIRLQNKRYILYYTAWTTSPKRLGMVFCYQRTCSVYSIDVTDLLFPTSEPAPEGSDLSQAVPLPVCLTASCALARSPRVSPDGSTLVFVGRQQPMSTHNGCFQLLSLSLTSDEGPKVVLDLVETPSEDLAYPGLYCDQLPRQCFADLTGKRVVLSSMWGSRESVSVVDLCSGTIARLTDNLAPPLLPSSSPSSTGGGWSNSADASSSVLDVDAARQQLLFTVSSPNSPPRVGLWDLGSSRLLATGPLPVASTTSLKAETGGAAPASTADSAAAAAIDDVTASLAAMRWKVLKHCVSSVGSETASPATKSTASRFESILLLPPTRGDTPQQRVPLLVVPHGGPHSCTPTSFLASYAFLAAATQSAVLNVNYRGSTGFGQASIDSLPGNIGRNDVQDMVQATQEALQAYPELLDDSRLAVVGGSHGGFLTAHLIGQHPSMFKAAAMRNPVTNIPSMNGVTDIPDWCVVEAGHKYDFSRYGFSSADVLATMLAASPVVYIDAVKTPTLMCLGLKDRRVPASQGIEYYHLLKARGIPAKMLVFPEDTHAIDQPASEAEHFVAISMWFNQYLNA